MCAVDYVRAREEGTIEGPWAIRQMIRGIQERANFPGQEREVIRLDPDGNPYVTTARWGLIPAWAKDPKDVGNTYNCRDDSLWGVPKPSFQRGFAQGRCLLVGTSFIEHCDRLVPRSTPLEFAIDHDKPYLYAGLVDSWGKGDEQFESCTMITCEPNELVGYAHSRMPVILRGEAEYEAWLNPRTPVHDLLDLLRPYPHQRMSMRPAVLPPRRKPKDKPVREQQSTAVDDSHLEESLF